MTARPLRERVRREWRNGRHSRLPRCCVLWFVVVHGRSPRWRSLILRWNIKRGRVFIDSVTGYVYSVGEPNPERGYVRCPLCVVRRRWARQHICGPACPPPFRRLAPF